MPRFDKLEIGSPVEPDDAAVAARRTAEADETSWMRRADEERRQGHYENALRYYSRALELDKSLVSGWLGQVQMLIHLGEYPEAEVWSRKALELFPSNGELLAGRGQALCRRGDLKQAHVLCDGALGQAGQSAYRWMVRGELMVAGRQDIDRHCFDKALQLDGDWLVPLEIALIYLHHGLPSKGLTRAHQAVERAPDSHYPWNIQGVCQTELGLPQQAQRSLQRCLEICPRHRDAESRLLQLESAGWSLTRTLRRLLGRS